MNRIKLYIITFIFFISVGAAQSFMMQGWYWDYPKDGCNSYSGDNWAETLNGKVSELAAAGFDYLWLPPLSRTSSGNCSNGYDPKDLYDLGEYGGGRSGFGTRTELTTLLSALSAQNIKPVADVVYNHRDGGAAEDNSAVEGWIENFTSTKVDAGDNAYPSDRFRCVLPIGGSTGRGAGTYYFKIRSASRHANFVNKKYKVYMWTNVIGWQSLGDVNEVEPNGGGDCAQGNNTITLGRNYWAWVDPATGCGTDEFALTLGADDFNSTGDNIYIVLSNDGGYSDHYIYGIWYTGTNSDVQSALKYQTYTDFSGMPSGEGSMNYMNFKPNGNPTNLNGDWDWMWFYYDYDQSVASTKTALFDWTKWLWTDVGIRGYRMDAVKHFTPEFVGDLLDNLHDNSINPSMVVGEFYDANAGNLKNWIDQVNSYMDTDTKAAISPKIFDFSLREALKNACDNFGEDVRNIFSSSLVDAVGASGFNVVTFAGNHDFRDGDQPIQNDPILAYAYILTNNQLGLPCVYYPDYYGTTITEAGLKSEIDALMDVHSDYIFGASSRDYLTREGTPYNPDYNNENHSTTTLVYQLMGVATGKDVIVGINFAGEALDMWVGVNGGGLTEGATLGDRIGNSNLQTLTVSGGRVNIQLPARSYSVWVEGEAALPVELTSFTATVSENNVELNWQTATEINNFGFNIERASIAEENGVSAHASTPLSMTNEWKDIGFVKGHGNSNSVKEYRFVDKYLAPGDYQYRLKQIDTDGKFEYSKTVEISFIKSTLKQFKLSQNYPNPFNPATTINFSIPEIAGGNSTNVSLKVFDILGNKLVELINEEMYPGQYQINFDAKNLPSGIYYYTLRTEQFSETRKMVLIK